MDEGRADGRIESLPKRCRLVRELRMLFGCTGPTMTVEMELSGGVTSERRPGIQSVIRQFRSVLPIKIELAHATDAENQHAIEMAVEVARRIAVSSGYPSGMYMNFLELRRRRALQVLEALSQGPARVTMAEDI